MITSKNLWVWLSCGPANVIDGLVHMLSFGYCSLGLSSACYYRSLDCESLNSHPRDTYPTIHDEGPEPEDDTFYE